MTAFVALLLAATPAAAHSPKAHPLGNFTINHYNGLVVTSSGITDNAVLDAAEIPTYSQRSSVDTDGDQDVSAAERSAFAAEQCPLLAAKLELRVDGAVRPWKVDASSFTYRHGAAGLETSRLECDLSIDADLSQRTAVTFEDGYLADRVGWREITVAGDQMTVTGAEVGARSLSSELRQYPNDLLSSPLDERTVKFSAVPGPSTHSQTLPDVSDPGWTTQLLGDTTAKLNRLVERDLTVQVGLLAVLLSLILGASHAALPGHGKTIMAAYMVGTRGTPKDAFLIGATVTLTHTAGVLVLGLLASAFATFAGDRLLAVLGVISGAIVASIGVWLLRGAWQQRQRRRSGVVGQQDAVAAHGHNHHHGLLHGHGHGADHSHVHSVGEPHSHEPAAALDPEHGSGLVTGQARPPEVDVAGGATTLLVGAARQQGHVHDHGHDDDAVHEHELGHGPGHSHEPGHGHDHGPGHSHNHQGDQIAGPGSTDDGDQGREPPEARGYRRLVIVGMGLAGGLVPSPTALVVLLGAIGLGRTAFGVVLVLGYGIGMAATLICVGYLIAVLPRRFPSLGAACRRPWMARLVSIGPVLTSSLVLVVGIGLVLRSAVPLV